MFHCIIGLCVISAMCNLKSYETKGNVYVNDKSTIILLIAIILETVNRHLKYPNRNSPICIPCN